MRLSGASHASLCTMVGMVGRHVPGWYHGGYGRGGIYQSGTMVGMIGEAYTPGYTTRVGEAYTPGYTTRV